MKPISEVIEELKDKAEKAHISTDDYFCSYSYQLGVDDILDHLSRVGVDGRKYLIVDVKSEFREVVKKSNDGQTFKIPIKLQAFNSDESDKIELNNIGEVVAVIESLPTIAKIAKLEEDLIEARHNEQGAKHELEKLKLQIETFGTNCPTEYQQNLEKQRVIIVGQDECIANLEERVKELEEAIEFTLDDGKYKHIKRVTNNIDKADNLNRRFDRQEKIITLLEQSNEFYASKNNWNDRWFESPDGNEDNDGDIFDVIDLQDVEIGTKENRPEDCSYIGHYTYGGKLARQIKAQVEAIKKENKGE